MDSLKVLVINEGIIRSFIKDTYTFGCLLASFWLNQQYLGHSIVMQLILGFGFVCWIINRTKAIKYMNVDKALEYLKQRKENEQI